MKQEKIDLRELQEHEIKDTVTWAVSLAYTCSGERVLLRADNAVAAIVSLEDAKRLEALDHGKS